MLVMSVMLAIARKPAARGPGTPLARPASPSWQLAALSQPGGRHRLSPLAGRG
jgi:hypothetical protein